MNFPSSQIYDISSNGLSKVLLQKSVLNNDVINEIIGFVGPNLDPDVSSESFWFKLAREHIVLIEWVRNCMHIVSDGFGKMSPYYSCLNAFAIYLDDMICIYHRDQCVSNAYRIIDLGSNDDVSEHFNCKNKMLTKIPEKKSLKQMIKNDEKEYILRMIDRLKQYINYTEKYVLHEIGFYTRQYPSPSIKLSRLRFTYSEMGILINELDILRDIPVVSII